MCVNFMLCILLSYMAESAHSKRLNKALSDYC